MLGRHGRGGLKIFNALNFSYSKDLELGPMLCNGAYRGTRGNGSPLIDSLIAAYASIAVPSHTCSRKSVMQTSSVQRRVWPKFRERGQASHPNRTTILQNSPPLWCIDPMFEGSVAVKGIRRLGPTLHSLQCAEAQYW